MKDNTLRKRIYLTIEKEDWTDSCLIHGDTPLADLQATILQKWPNLKPPFKAQFGKVKIDYRQEATA